MNRANENNMNMNRTKQNSTPNIRWMLVGYDLIVYAVVAVILLVLYGGMDKLSTTGILQQVCLSVLCIFVARLIGKIYGQVWRYGGIQCYIRLLFTDSIAFVAYLCLELLLPVQKITFARMLSLVCLNLLGALALRMMYRYAYKCGNQETTRGKILSTLLHMFSGIEAGNEKEVQKIKVAIIGAGRVGVSLAEELLNNSEAAYIPRGFIDVNKEKVGREIHDIPVWSEDEATLQKLGEFEVQEIIFAIPSMDAEKKKALYEYYKNAGYKLKVYDYPTMYTAGGKRHLREFDIEELLFRKPLVVSDERTNAYYKDKIVLITGGGGSIGSELCRQLAKMNPKKITGSAGGCFLTDDEEAANKVRKWSTQARENAAWYQHEELGYNYRMSNVVAGVVRGQFPYLKEHIAQKKAIYERYKEGLKGLPVSMNPMDLENSEPNYWLSCLIINKEAMCKQVRGEQDVCYVKETGKSCPTEILEAIASINAEGRPIWKPMHMQPIYRLNPFVVRDGNGRARSNAYIAGGVADVGMDIFTRGLCLPSDNKMTAEQQDRIIEVIKACFE